MWRLHTPGADEAFDVERFGVWLEVLMQCGATVAARSSPVSKSGTRRRGVLGPHGGVRNRAAVSSYTTLDGDHVPGRVSNDGPTAEIGG